ncbi:hypothetical protein P280DRAFT_477655 [Massarina eburnea CBS 473.64]|uniref:RING-type domain-containing protein n=1 Tax=Massarina eburnea CBS 473.64 TaxID=1395130 RepID=A0A6A6SAK3_9PLEO|nr:hypothetical protein P280DRAFT_477655 [Massarina eburnea CBS 473.64]
MTSNLPTRGDFFTSSVDIVDISTLDEDNITCAICTGDFTTLTNTKSNSRHEAALAALEQLPFAELPNNGLDIPISLPCGHIFGSHCLRVWLSKGTNTCPFCRAELFNNKEDKKTPVDILFDEYNQLHSFPIRELLTPAWENVKHRPRIGMTIWHNPSTQKMNIISLVHIIFKVSTRFGTITRSASNLVFPEINIRGATTGEYFTHLIDQYLPAFLHANELPADEELTSLLTNSATSTAYQAVADYLEFLSSKNAAGPKGCMVPGLPLLRFSRTETGFSQLPVVWLLALTQKVADRTEGMRKFRKVVIFQNLWLMAFVEYLRRVDDLGERKLELDEGWRGTLGNDEDWMGNFDDEKEMGAFDVFEVDDMSE